jgi:hypothetical protein
MVFCVRLESEQLFSDAQGGYESFLINRFKPLKSYEEGKPETTMFLAFLYILFAESTSKGAFP